MHDQSDRPVEHLTSLYRGDLYEHRSILRRDAGAAFLAGLLSEVGAMACLAVDPEQAAAGPIAAGSGDDRRLADGEQVGRAHVVGDPDDEIAEPELLELGGGDRVAPQRGVLVGIEAERHQVHVARGSEDRDRIHLPLQQQLLLQVRRDVEDVDLGHRVEHHQRQMMRRADARFRASIINSNSIKCSSTGRQVG